MRVLCPALAPREYSCTVSTLSIPIPVYVLTYALASVSPGPSERLIYYLVNGEIRVAILQMARYRTA